jgi:hypothetical protein
MGWVVPLPGADVAKNRRYRGEISADSAFVNGRETGRAAQIVSAMHRVCYANCVMPTRMIVVQMNR